MTAKHIIPFIEAQFPLKAGLRVLVIGCGEGGVLKAFLDKGLSGVGIEISPRRKGRAVTFLAPELQAGRATLRTMDIYAADPARDLGGPCDLVIMKDVIEHIPDHGRLLARLHAFLKPGGAVFIGFPPWQMPFGGHQQVSSNRLLSRLPWFSLLPRFLYAGILQAFGESESRIGELLEVKATGLSLGRLERLFKANGYGIAARTLYLVNPIYRYKFGLKPRRQLPVLRSIPYLRILSYQAAVRRSRVISEGTPRRRGGPQ